MCAGMCHGDLYGHNIMCSRDGTVLLGDFGAATIYRGDFGNSSPSCSSNAANSSAGATSFGPEIENKLQKIEVRALGILMLELLAIVEDQSESDLVRSLNRIASCCTREPLDHRPLFEAVDCELQALVAQCTGSCFDDS